MTPTDRLEVLSEMIDSLVLAIKKQEQRILRLENALDFYALGQIDGGERARLAILNLDKSVSELEEQWSEEQRDRKRNGLESWEFRTKGNSVADKMNRGDF